VTAWSYEHRCQWTEDRLHELARIFAIELCGYVAMSNHYHVVLYVDREAATAWSLDDVIEQSHQLFSGNLLSRRHRSGEKLSASDASTLSTCVETWRERLIDISWFMRVLNEGIARQANKEDDCTGRFWE